MREFAAARSNISRSAHPLRPSSAHMDGVMDQPTEPIRIVGGRFLSREDATRQKLKPRRSPPRQPRRRTKSWRSSRLPDGMSFRISSHAIPPRRARRSIPTVIRRLGCRAGRPIFPGSKVMRSKPDGHFGFAALLRLRHVCSSGSSPSYRYGVGYPRAVRAPPDHSRIQDSEGH